MYYSFNGKRESDRSRALEIGELMSVVMSVGPEFCQTHFDKLTRLGVDLGDESSYAAIHLASSIVFDEENESHMTCLTGLERQLDGIEDCHILTFGGRVFALICRRGGEKDPEGLIAELKDRMEIFLAKPENSLVRAIVAGMADCRHAVRHCAFQCSSRNEFHDFLENPPRLVALRHELGMLAVFGEDLDKYQLLCNKLAVLVRSENFSPLAAAKELVDGVIQACAENIIPVQTHVHMLALILTRTVVDSGLCDAEFSKRLIGEKKLLSGHTEREMLSLADEYFTELHRQYLIMSHNLVADRMRQIKEYVETNITAYDLSVTSVSDMFGVNRSLLTSQFKRHYGMSLSGYIQTCRVEKAKALMEENPGWSMDSVSRAAGYSSLSTMYRAFKKQDGIAPGSYRG